MFSPEAPYEQNGDVPGVVFPCGQTIGADGDTINLYYGAGDSCLALATGSIRTLFSWLDANASWGDDPTGLPDLLYQFIVSVARRVLLISRRSRGCGEVGSA
jgi:hypothetical protein